MTALSGAIQGLRMLADGTIRLTVDIEPKDRVDAMTLFGSIGQPVALAALMVGHAAVKEKTPDPRGPLCKSAIELCKNTMFHEFIAVEHYAKTQEAAKSYILHCCGITSRKELDTNAEAAEIFRRRVHKEFQAWLRGQV